MKIYVPHYVNPTDRVVAALRLHFQSVDSEVAGVSETA